MSRTKKWFSNAQKDLLLEGLDVLFCSQKITKFTTELIKQTATEIYNSKAKRVKKYDDGELLSPNERRNKNRRMNYLNDPKYREVRLLSGKNYVMANKEYVKKRQEGYRAAAKEEKARLNS